MAHVVGVPKRDPCVKCSLPVFLAERTTIGPNVYHRTCLKCARCSSQLTVGSFYETEVDGEFCCETCPDEEEEEEENLTKRSSIADRLAFFESNQNDQAVLTKSLSDEEKSKSLKAGAKTIYKSNSAFKDFVSDAVMAEKKENTHGYDHEEVVPVPVSLTPPSPSPTAVEPSTFTSSIVVKIIETPTKNDLKSLKNISSSETKDNEEDGISKVEDNLEKSPEYFVTPTLDLETTNRLSLVSARLNQFEESISDFQKQEQINTEDPIAEQVPATETENNIVPSISPPESEKTPEPFEYITIKDLEEEDQENVQSEEQRIDTISSDQVNFEEPSIVVQENSSANAVSCLDSEDTLEESQVLEDIQEKSKSSENSNTIVVQEVPSTETDEIAVVSTPSIPEIIVHKVETAHELSEHNNNNEGVEETSESLPCDMNGTKSFVENGEKIEQVPLDLEKENEDQNNYPDNLNPFQSDDDDDDESKTKPLISPMVATVTPSTNNSLNPFDSSDDEVELDKVKVKPPRPPPPRVSKNPFGSESEDEESAQKMSTANRTPIPKPRSSTNPTPEPTPRPSLKKNFNASTPLNNNLDVYGSTLSLNRYCDSRGSNNSLTSNVSSANHSRKTKRAPLPPGPVIKELFPSNETLSSAGSSNSTTPKQGRKKRPAPLPPILTTITSTVPKNLNSCPQQSQLSDEEKALLEGNGINVDKNSNGGSRRRLIALDMRIVNDQDASNDICKKEEENVVYRRKIIPLEITTPTTDDNDNESTPSTRQLEKLKDNKESQNRNRQSQIHIPKEDNNEESFLNKSVQGKWKRRKGPAPQLPVPPRKVLQMLPLQEIRHELEIIEVQQQGLEKQGVVLEKMIRERCEGKNGELQEIDGKQVPNSKEVEDLILQLFELVNEKNELFRRQAELMYLRRQHRLEQEQADLEYEIRVLMAQPERNKTDSDKSREESMIARLVEVVQLRNEVIECLEMDRVREAEEDLSIKQQLEIHSARRENDSNSQSGKESSELKLSKKEKKKQKEAKRLGKSRKIDADKDTDESELAKEKIDRKKKKKFLFLH